MNTAHSGDYDLQRRNYIDLSVNYRYGGMNHEQTGRPLAVSAGRA